MFQYSRAASAWAYYLKEQVGAKDMPRLGQADKAWYDVETLLLEVLDKHSTWTHAPVAQAIQHFVVALVRAKRMENFEINAEYEEEYELPDHGQTRSTLLTTCLYKLDTAPNESDALTALAVLKIEGAEKLSSEYFFGRNMSERQRIAHEIITPGSEAELVKEDANGYRQRAQTMIDEAKRSTAKFVADPLQRRRRLGLLL